MEELLWRPLTFWDEEQIAFIKKEERTQQIPKHIRKKIEKIDKDIKNIESEIFNLEDEISDLESEKFNLKVKKEELCAEYWITDLIFN